MSPTAKRRCHLEGSRPRSESILGRLAHRRPFGGHGYRRGHRDRLGEVFDFLEGTPGRKSKIAAGRGGVAKRPVSHNSACTRGELRFTGRSEPGGLSGTVGTPTGPDRPHVRRLATTQRKGCRGRARYSGIARGRHKVAWPVLRPYPLPPLPRRGHLMVERYSVRPSCLGSVRPSGLVRR